MSGCCIGCSVAGRAVPALRTARPRFDCCWGAMRGGRRPPHAAAPLACNHDPPPPPSGHALQVQVLCACVSSGCAANVLCARPCTTVASLSCPSDAWGMRVARAVLACTIRLPWPATQQQPPNMFTLLATTTHSTAMWSGIPTLLHVWGRSSRSLCHTLSCLPLLTLCSDICQAGERAPPPQCQRCTQNPRLRILWASPFTSTPSTNPSLPALLVSGLGYPPLHGTRKQQGTSPAECSLHQTQHTTATSLLPQPTPGPPPPSRSD